MLDIWTSPISLIIGVLFLIFLAPRFIRYLVPFVLNFRRRNEKQSLQTQIVEYRKELAKISQTDEFAKYSKVQRKLRATSDQLGNLSRQDLELNFKYVLIAQGLAWISAIGIAFKLIYQLYTTAMYQMGFMQERTYM